MARRRWRAGQGDNGIRLPRIFPAIDDEDPGEEFNFVAEQLEGERAGQEGGIHENAFSEWDLAGHGPGLGEKEGGGW